MSTSIAQKILINELFAVSVKAVSPNDPTGHIPNCGYTDELPACGCSEYGERLYQGLKDVVERLGLVDGRLAIVS